MIGVMFTLRHFCRSVNVTLIIYQYVVKAVVFVTLVVAAVAVFALELVAAAVVALAVAVTVAVADSCYYF